jgi:hypothetical protein
MSTLNGGFSLTKPSIITEEEKSLIDEYIRTKGVTKLQPAGVDGNEISRRSREAIAKARREFRKNAKANKT